MNNNDLMRLLSQINENNDQRKQMTGLWILMLTALAGCIVLASKYQQSRKDNKTSEKKHLILSKQLKDLHGPIEEMQRTIYEKSLEMDRQQKIIKILSAIKQKESAEPFTDIIPVS